MVQSEDTSKLGIVGRVVGPDDSRLSLYHVTVTRYIPGRGGSPIRCRLAPLERTSPSLSLVASPLSSVR